MSHERDDKMERMDHERFLADVAAHPHDPASRLVYADWLEERGDKRADFIRLVVEGIDGAHATPKEICEAAGIEWQKTSKEHPNDYRNTVRAAQLDTH
ncbi:MAG: TIGR02996 domain-containing protein, partial [Planctomycetales bacterium]